MTTRAPRRDAAAHGHARVEHAVVADDRLRAHDGMRMNRDAIADARGALDDDERADRDVFPEHRVRRDHR